MKPEEIQEVLEYAEHFDGDLKLAAAAKVFGLGIIKLKKRLPVTSTIVQRREVSDLAKAAEKAMSAKSQEAPKEEETPQENTN